MFKQCLNSCRSQIYPFWFLFVSQFCSVDDMYCWGSHFFKPPQKFTFFFGQSFLWLQQGMVTNSREKKRAKSGISLISACFLLVCFQGRVAGTQTKPGVPILSNLPCFRLIYNFFKKQKLNWYLLKKQITALHLLSP